MKKALVSIVAIAGLATVASATSTITFQVRPVGQVNWESNINVAPGTAVEFRAIVGYSGGQLPSQAPNPLNYPYDQSNPEPQFVQVPGTVKGLFGVNTQPRVSNWDPSIDALGPFNATAGVNTNTTYGRARIASTGTPGISAANALRGHTNNVISGVRYLRIAQNTITNWTGAGPTSGTAAVNNFNGAGGLPIAQNGPFTIASFNSNITDLEILRFRITVGGAATRTLVIDSALEALSLNEQTGQRRVQWYMDNGFLDPDFGDPLPSSVPSDDTDIVINAASVTVPTPGALALLGMGGLIAGRRRRA